MFRLGTPTALGIFVFVLATAAAQPPDDPFQKTLAVQAAMRRAREFSTDNNSQKAVQILEENLRSVNGNSEYLVLLRDCYRVYIKDLYHAGQPELAKRYLARLVILDASAANDPGLRPQGNTEPRKFEPEPEPVKQVIAIPFPKFKMPGLTNPFAKKEAPKDVPPTAVRARADEVSVEDPFDPKFQRETPKSGTPQVQAQQYLTTGIKEFANKRYTEARVNFEQARQLDQASGEMCREQYAYCLIKDVSDRLDQSPANKLGDLQRQVDEAMKMSLKLEKTGKELLQKIDQRGKQPASVKMNHIGANREGWQVTETANFRIFHKQDNAFAEQVGQIAEQTRLTMYRKWFGHDGVEWQLPCELIMHPSAESYTQMTGVPNSSPGHTRIESDPAGRIISRRMDLRCDMRGMMDAVLPHEATHVILAGMFGTGHVPRWADEGIAVLSEPNEKIELHRRNLLKSQLFGLRELMEMKDYPQPRQVSAFYAQSVVLTEFLANQKGPKVLADFVKDAQRYGYDASLQKHYGWSFAQLDQQWNQQVMSNPNRFAAQK